MESATRPSLSRSAIASLLVAALIVVVVAGMIAWMDRGYVDAATVAPSIETTTTTTRVLSTQFHVAVAGDVGTGEPEAYLTAAVMDELDAIDEYDALLLLGDNVYENGNPADVQEKVLEPFAAVLDGETRLVAVLGNHDVRDDNGDAQAAALGMPNRWYTFGTDTTTIVALDSTQAGNADQLDWLRSTLEATQTEQAWTIVIMHHPAFSAGRHGNEPSVQEHFVPLFEEYGVDLVLSGHDHDYQRTHLINGVTYVVTGAAAKLRPTGRTDFTAVSSSTYSFVDLVIHPERIEAQAIDHDGQPIDMFTLVRSPG